MAAIAPYQVDSGDGETSVSKSYHKGSKLPALLASAFPFNEETIHPTSLLSCQLFYSKNNHITDTFLRQRLLNPIELKNFRKMFTFMQKIGIYSDLL
jgi:hypothetical protein